MREHTSLHLATSRSGSPHLVVGGSGSERLSATGFCSSSVAVVCYRAVRAVALRARAEATGYLAIPLLLRMEGRSEPVGSTLRNSLVFAGLVSAYTSARNSGASGVG
jgi:hypothetical protein